MGRGCLADVQGTSRLPYQVDVSIRRGRAGHATVAGNCSCPVSFNCKHVVATLLAASALPAAASEAPRPKPAASAPHPASARHPAPAAKRPASAAPAVDAPMPWPVSAWLRDLKSAAQDREAAAAADRQRMFYLAEIDPARASRAI